MIGYFRNFAEQNIADLMIPRRMYFFVLRHWSFVKRYISIVEILAESIITMLWGRSVFLKVDLIVVNNMMHTTFTLVILGSVLLVPSLWAVINDFITFFFPIYPSFPIWTLDNENEKLQIIINELLNIEVFNCLQVVEYCNIDFLWC